MVLLIALVFNLVSRPELGHPDVMKRGNELQRVALRDIILSVIHVLRIHSMPVAQMHLIVAQILVG